MSKSIYEEAYLILNSRIADGEVKSFKVTGTTYCKINNALKQAQKQDKLFELYNRLFNVCKEYKCASIGLSDDSEFLNVMSELEEEENE